ncbi:MAG: DUF1573 domain-containing protein [Saprospiraceae bacterium]|nr:DUF1573 domain-containing protein [Saprospiraceae bacterium]
MKTFLISLIAVLASFAPSVALAQSNGAYHGGYKIFTQNLPPEQVFKLDSYMRHMTKEYDMDVKYLFEKLTQTQNERMKQYLKIMQTDFVNLEKTTVRWQPDTLNFGTIEEQTIVLDSFQVTNTGIHPYMIREVKPTCDCAVLRYPDFPIMPGETASIRIEFNSKNKAGRATPGIIIYDNSSPNRRHIIYLDGNVAPRGKVKSIMTSNME